MPTINLPGSKKSDPSSSSCFSALRSASGPAEPPGITDVDRERDVVPFLAAGPVEVLEPFAGAETVVVLSVSLSLGFVCLARGFPTIPADVAFGLAVVFDKPSGLGFGIEHLDAPSMAPPFSFSWWRVWLSGYSLAHPYCHLYPCPG